MCTATRQLTPGTKYRVEVSDVGLKIHVVFPALLQVPPANVHHIESRIVDAVAASLATLLPSAAVCACSSDAALLTEGCYGDSERERNT